MNNPLKASIPLKTGDLDLQPVVKREWQASLSLDFQRRRQRTVLVGVTHHGPLRVQCPFYPEGECCHCYLLHPPGGIAPGDALSIAVSQGSHTHTLLTTPSAGRVYQSDAAGHSQKQGIVATVANDAFLEWLPQETIIYAGAQTSLTNRFELHGSAQLFGWDIICLGRRASNEVFHSGQCVQQIEICRDGKWLLRERTRFDGGSDMLQKQWGMAGYTVTGTLFATVDCSRQQLDAMREKLAAMQLQAEWGITQKPGLFLARFLGQSAEQGRRGFETIWQQLRPQFRNNLNACRPRIWNT